MNDEQFIEYGYEVVANVRPGILYFRVPEPARKISLTPVDMEFELAIMDVPGVTTFRVCEFEKVNGNWRFVRIDRL